MVLAALGSMKRASGCSGRARVASRASTAILIIAILARDDLPPAFFAELQDEIEESTIPYDVDLVDLRTRRSGAR